MLPEAIDKLVRWKKAGETEQGRNWQLTSWGGGGVKLTLGWRFGDAQLGGLEKVFTYTEADAKFDVLTEVVDFAIREFEMWERLYNATKQGG